MKPYRKLITTSVGFSFFVVGVTGVIFKLWFKNHALEEIHGWLGLAMVTAAIFHIVQNWSSLRRHLRDPRVFALALPIALVCVVFARQNEPARGVNPRRVIHQLTRASIKDVAKVLGQDANQVLSAMTADGLAVTDAAQAIDQLAEKNRREPEQLLAYFVP